MKAWLWLVLLVAGLAQAQAYRWVDRDGKVHYGDRPPPDVASKAQERKLAAPAADRQIPFAMRQAVANYPVTLHVSSNCGEGCKAGREYLARRGIPFSEKSVATPEEVEALKQLSGGGTAEVPVLQAGAKTTKGWLQSDWQRLLDAAGYPKEAGR